METYNHTEQPDEQLFNRLQELQELDQDWQGEVRRAHVKLEMACIVFEQCARYASSHPEMVEAVL